MFAHVLYIRTVTYTTGNFVFFLSFYELFFQSSHLPLASFISLFGRKIHYRGNVLTRSIEMSLVVMMLSVILMMLMMMMITM